MTGIEFLEVAARADGLAELRVGAGWSAGMAGLVPVLRSRAPARAEGRTPVPPRRPTTCYGTPAFATASRFIRDLAGSESPWARGTLLAGDLRSAVTTARLVRHLPTVEVEISDEPGGQAILGLVARRRALVPVGRLARAVLVVPPSVTDYLRGRSKQAVRTNVRHADALGITCESIAGMDDRRTCVAQVVGHRTVVDDVGCAWLEDLLRLGECHVARAADGRPLAFASVWMDVRCAYLGAFLRAEDDDDASWARYLLTVYLVGQLAKAGITHLLTDNALRPTPGVQYFQHLTGFTAANVAVRRFEA